MRRDYGSYAATRTATGSEASSARNARTPAAERVPILALVDWLGLAVSSIGGLSALATIATEELTE